MMKTTREDNDNKKNSVQPERLKLRAVLLLFIVFSLALQVLSIMAHFHIISQIDVTRIRVEARLIRIGLYW